MKKICKQFLVMALTLCLSLTLVMAFAPAEAQAKVATDTGVTRIYDDNYCANSINVAAQFREEMGSGRLPALILVSGSSYRNGISASYLAKTVGAPIIFARTRDLDRIVKFARNNLSKNATVYIIGDTLDISGKFDTAMTRNSLRVKRISGGGIKTLNLSVIKAADEISKKNRGKIDRTIMVCSIDRYYEGMVAAATGHPVLLVEESLTNAQIQFLKNRGRGNFAVIGDTDVVSSSVFNNLRSIGTTNRYYGNNPYDTAVMVGKKFFGAKSKEAVLVNANNYYDGIMGAPLAQAKNCPILLTSPAKPAYAYNYEVRFHTKETTIIGNPHTVETRLAATSNRFQSGWNNYNEKYIFITSSGRMAVDNFTTYGYTISPSAGGVIEPSGYRELSRIQDSASYGTAIVIHIGEQKLDFVRNGELRLSTNVVTGNRGHHDTPTGIFSINAKARNVNLVGPTWNSFVNYWMPFHRGYYGIHDATWRSSFGGSIYRGNGSHGCVNVPYSKMVQLWGMVGVGTKVVIKY